MSAGSSPASSPEQMSALKRLERDADEDNDDDVRRVIRRRSDSGAKLRAWREAEEDGDRASTPKRQLTWSDMHAMFPSIQRAGDERGEIEGMQGVQLSDTAPTKPKVNRWKAHQLRQTKTQRAKKESNATSDMGLFSLLPGELRNSIYRLAFVPPPHDQPVIIVGSDLVCGRGACVHKRAPIAAPAIASTCSQIRNETMPIFCTENAFRFDAVMVRNRCAAAWMKSMNTYARMIRIVTLEVLLLNRNAPGVGTDSQLGEIEIDCPVARADGKFELMFSANIPRAKVDDSKLLALIERLNGDDAGERGRASKFAFILGSDELAELVFRCKK